MNTQQQNKEPLPIWFFVGIILFVYGILVVAGQAVDPGKGVLKSLTPGYWWGAIMLVGGAVFTAVGLIAHRKQ